jgi:hypothetical protein
MTRMLLTVSAADIGRAQLRLVDQAASPILDFELTKFLMVQVWITQG